MTPTLIKSRRACVRACVPSRSLIIRVQCIIIRGSIDSDPS